MVTHMKTTLEISEKLFRDAKEKALKRGKTFRQIVEEALNQFLYAEKPKAKTKFKIHSFKGDGLVEGVSLEDWPAIRALIYEGRGG
jgi:hypothetical protein